MQNSFEESVKQQLSEFTITPKKEIWNDIEQSLDANNNKRKAILLWLTLGLLIIGLSDMGYNHFFTYKPTTNSQQLVKKSAINNRQLNNAKSNLSISKKVNPLTQDKEKNTSSPTNKATTDNKIRLPLDVKNTNKSVRINEIKFSANDFSKQTKRNSSEHFIENTEQISGNKNNTETTKGTNFLLDTFSKAKPLISQKIATKDSSNLNNTTHSNNQQIEIIAKANSSNDSMSGKIVDLTLHQKKSRFLFEFAGGILSISNNTYNNSNLPLSTASSGSSNTTFADIRKSTLQPQKGIAIKMGVIYQQDFCKRWQFETGLNFEYIKNQQAVGLQMDSALLSDNGHYFLAGNNKTISNYAHYIQLPLKVKYELNPNSSIPFHILIGGSLGYQLQSKWLISERSNEILYYKKSLTNHILYNGFIGIGATLKNKISIDIIAEKAMSTLQEKTYNRNLPSIISLDIIIPKDLIIVNHKTKK